MTGGGYQQLQGTPLDFQTYREYPSDRSWVVHAMNVDYHQDNAGALEFEAVVARCASP